MHSSRTSRARSRFARVASVAVLLLGACTTADNIATWSSDEQTHHIGERTRPDSGPPYVTLEASTPELDAESDAIADATVEADAPYDAPADARTDASDASDAGADG